METKNHIHNGTDILAKFMIAKNAIMVLTFLALCFSAKSQTWSTVGSGLTGSQGTYFYAHPTTSNLIVGTSTTTIKQWDDATITSYSPALPSASLTSIVDYSGKLYAKASATSTLQSWDYVATSWSTATGAIMNYKPMEDHASRIYLLSTSPATVPTTYNGTSAVALPITVFTAGSVFITNAKELNDTLYTVGRMNTGTSAGSLVNSPLVMHVGMNYASGWSAFTATGAISAGDASQCVAKYNNVLYIGGSFNSATNYLCKWNGSSWTAITGGGLSATVKDLCVFNGKLYLATSNQIYSYDGTSISLVATATGTIADIETRGMYVYVTGNFTAIGTVTTDNIARFTDVLPVTSSISSSTNVLCNGGNNGSATVSFTGGVGPFTYDWIGTGQTTATATGLNAGTYSVVVTDSFGNDDTATVVITEPSALSSNLYVTNVTCNGMNNGSITVEPVGGTAPYTYSWDHDSFLVDSIATGLSPLTSYSVVVTDANGCEDSIATFVTEPTALILDSLVTVPQTVPGINGQITVYVSGGTSPYTYALNSGSLQSSNNFNGLASGNYFITVTDSNGCSVSDSVFVDLVTGMNEVATDKLFEVYPNPSNGPITINGNGNYSLYNQSGSLIRTLEVNGKISINIDPGVYYLVGESNTTKLVRL